MAYEFIYGDKDKFDWIPTNIAYSSFNPGVSNMRVEFSKADGTQVVVFKGITTKEGEGAIDIRSLTPSSGAAFLKKKGFARIRFSFVGTEKLIWAGVMLSRDK